MTSTRRLTALGLSVLLLCAAAAGLAGSSRASVPGYNNGQCSGENAQPGTVSTKRFEFTLRCLINHERESRGLVKYKSNGSLEEAARKHSKVMARRGCLAPQCIGEDDPGTRMIKAGYLDGGYYPVAGQEILAYGQAHLGTPKVLFRMWMQSTSKQHLLAKNLVHFGVGVAVKNKTAMVTVDMATRAK